VAPQPDPITLEEAGAVFGGRDRPWSRKTVERVIAAGLLRDYGRGATRRVLRGDVERLIERFATGEAHWPPRKASRGSGASTAPALSRNSPNAQRVGGRQNESKVYSSGDVQLVSKPPRRGSRTRRLRLPDLRRVQALWGTGKGSCGNATYPPALGGCPRPQRARHRYRAPLARAHKGDSLLKVPSSGLRRRAMRSCGGPGRPPSRRHPT
jgi:hypothetical protein